MCYDRIGDGLTPACAQACPTESIQYGELDELRERAAARVDALHDGRRARGPAVRPRPVRRRRRRRRVLPAARRARGVRPAARPGGHHPRPAGDVEAGRPRRADDGGRGGRGVPGDGGDGGGRSRRPSTAARRAAGERPMVPPAEFRSYYGRPIVKAPVWKHDIAGVPVHRRPRGRLGAARRRRRPDRPAGAAPRRAAGRARRARRQHLLPGQRPGPAGAVPPHAPGGQADLADVGGHLDPRRVRPGRRRAAVRRGGAAAAAPRARSGSAAARCRRPAGRPAWRPRRSRRRWPRTRPCCSPTPRCRPGTRPTRELPFVFAGSALASGAGVGLIAAPAARGRPGPAAGGRRRGPGAGRPRTGVETPARPAQRAVPDRAGPGRLLRAGAGADRGRRGGRAARPAQPGAVGAVRGGAAGRRRWPPGSASSRAASRRRRTRSTRWCRSGRERPRTGRHMEPGSPPTTRPRRQRSSNPLQRSALGVHPVGFRNSVCGR